MSDEEQHVLALQSCCDTIQHIKELRQSGQSIADQLDKLNHQLDEYFIKTEGVKK